MVRTEVCLEAAVRAAAGVAVVVVGHLGGSITAGAFGGFVGPVFYLLAVVPAVVAGLYLAATGLWVLVDGATSAALERAQLAAAAANSGSGSGSGSGSSAAGTSLGAPNDEE